MGNEIASYIGATAKASWFNADVSGSQPFSVAPGVAVQELRLRVANCDSIERETCECR
jgi:hypothetical protein